MAELTDTARFITDEWVSTPVEYNQRDLLLYAVGIGCEELKFVYEQEPGFTAFPTYPVLLNMKGVSYDVDTPASSDRYLGKSKEPLFGGGPRVPMLKGVRVSVDAERYIERVKDLPASGARLVLKQRLMGVHKRGSGAITETEAELVGEDGTLYYRFVSGGFAIGAKDFKDGGRTNSAKVNTPPRDPDVVVEQVVSPTRAHVYRLSGDYNPLHIDPKSPMVVNSDFEGPILHGLCSMGHAARAVLASCANNDPSRFRALKVRFASPVYPGNTLVTRCWRTEKDRIVFTTTVKETGKVAISNAFMDLMPAANL
mmetsp:Transcript_57701/g.163883  ORF Transcript_57701/g.163883 Transcript_57701/m.163883 type:complete len:312 (-) Transcript_57701:116-1051(-)